jgi:MerR family transcriptional regulator, light-induced transcriptional regulator
MMTDSAYKEYLSLLLAGDRFNCAKLTQKLIDEKIDLEVLYASLFKRSLYEIGDLWEANKISVATEHMCTSITEYLMTLAYPLMFGRECAGKRAVVSCVANEYHQIGGKMVADMLELSGWDAYFLGANLPTQDLISIIDEKKPHLLCLSLSVYFNINNLMDAIKKVGEKWPELPIFVGGKALDFSAQSIFDPYKNVKFVRSLSELRNQSKVLEDRHAR